MQKTKQYEVASYLRISRDDGDKILSDSIANQRAMISEYVNNHEKLHISDEYIDDGYSGTNYDRPGFIRMMEDIKSGKINCVIVKDLSRLGRNYIETGRYLERIFPFYNVRFISILDSFDNINESGDADQIIVPFKNLINDAYCRDISMKIRSHFEVKRKNGQFIGSFASYGYEKDPYNRNHLVVDPYAGTIVKNIFDMKLDGMNSQLIADRLNDIGIQPPSEYKRSIGLKFEGGFRCSANPAWSAVSVTRVLTNEMYTGTMVQGVNEKISYRIKNSRPVPKEDWIRVKNTHEAIVSREIFDRVQELLGMDTRTAPDQDSLYLFSGLVACGSCRQNMVRRRVSKNKKQYVYYHCSTYKNGEGCTAHLFSDVKLQQVVLVAIQKQIELVVEAEKIIEKIDLLSDDNFLIRSLDMQIHKLLDEIERYKNLKTQLYTDKIEDLVTRDEYADINMRFTKKLEDAQEKCDRLTEKRKSLLKRDTHIKPWINEFKKYRNIKSLSRQIVVALIHQIIIYDKEKIQIIFRYQDEMKEMMLMAGVISECIMACDERHNNEIGVAI